MASSVDCQIRRQQSIISSCERNIDGARAQAASARAEKQKYERRKRQVEQVRSGLCNRFDGDVSQVKSAQTKTKNELNGAVEGICRESSLLCKIDADFEKDIENDRYGSQMLSLLYAEISECERRINEAASAEADANNIASSNQNQRSAAASYARQLMNDPEATIKYYIPWRY